MDHPSVWCWVMAVYACVCVQRAALWATAVKWNYTQVCSVWASSMCDCCLLCYSFKFLFCFFNFYFLLFLLLLLFMFKCRLDYRFSCFTFGKVFFSVVVPGHFPFTALSLCAMYLIWFCVFRHLFFQCFGSPGFAFANMKKAAAHTTICVQFHQSRTTNLCGKCVKQVKFCSVLFA